MPSRYHGTTEEVRALSALINLMRAADAFSGSLQREMAAKRLSGSQFGVLEALLHRGPLFQGDLAGKLLRSCGSITAVVEGLEKRGLVERRRDATDKRFVQVSLTGKGKTLIAGLFPAHAKAVAEQFSALSASETDQLRALCRKLGTSVAKG
jgi:MarR family 2-MHQ and catechol resistance regulon transcriptional repressor